MTQPTTADLQYIRQHWDDLTDQLTAHGTDTWPPTMGLRDYLATLDDWDRAQYAAEQAAERRERTPDAIGEHPAPLNLAVLDTVRAVRARLCGTADFISAHQPTDLPYASRWRGRWTADTSWRHGVPWAITWLEGALEWARPQQAQQIRDAARDARWRMAAALGVPVRRDTGERPCPACGGQLVLTQPLEGLPWVWCDGVCGGRWRGAELARLHDDLNRQAAA